MATFFVTALHITIIKYYTTYYNTQFFFVLPFPGNKKYIIFEEAVITEFDGQHFTLRKLHVQ